MRKDSIIVNLMHQLVRARMSAGLSQAGVGNLLDVGQSAIGGLETLRNDPRLSTLIKYARATGHNIEFKVVPIEQPELQNQSQPFLQQSHR